MEEKVSKIIEKIATENGFKNFNFHWEHGSDLGFTCDMKKCIITERDRKLSLMCKFLPSDSEQCSKFNSFLLYEREVKVYKELLTEYEKLQREFGIEINDPNGFCSYPKVFYCNYDPDILENSIIVMEDLTVDNFEVKDKYIPSDFSHTSKLFIELAKLHALSFALKHLKPEIFEKFKSLKNIMCNLMRTELMKSIAPRNCELVSKLFTDMSEQHIRDKILSYRTDMWDKIEKVVDGEFSEPYSVICHGDIWINNILFNYCDDKKQAIKDIKILDWQMSFYGSLGTELWSYLFNCVDKTIRDKHKEELFQMYYSTMESFLDKFKLNISEVLPLHEFRNQLQNSGLYSFGMCNFGITLLCKYPEKLFDDENCALTDEEMECVKKYHVRMRDIVLDMVEMKLF
jgi:Ecdysteroid kinase-like family